MKGQVSTRMVPVAFSVLEQWGCCNEGNLTLRPYARTQTVHAKRCGVMQSVAWPDQRSMEARATIERRDGRGTRCAQYQSADRGMGLRGTRNLAPECEISSGSSGG
jgi:hypothetical protein